MALTQVTGIKDDSIVNADVKSDAAIAKSKLAGLDIVNADVNASAAIAKSKLAGLDIVNADVNASAAIAGSKLAASTTSVAGSMSAADKTKLDGVAASANNYVHPNHSGEVTSTADGATVIADDVVDEANLKADNPPTNDYVLTAKSSAAGGLTWAAASGGISDVVSDTSPQLGGDLDVNGNQIKGDDVQIHAADDQVIAKFHKTNSSEFHFNGSKKLEVNNTGIGVTGSVTPSGGIYLGGSGGSNYLSDYEEGTFTPYFHLGSSPGAVTDGSKYLQQDGRYTKVGRFVSATFAVQGKHPDSAFDNWSSGDGFIKGWPFSFQGSQPQQVAFCRVHGGAGSWGTTYAPYVIYENYSDKAHLQAYNSGGVEPPGNVGNSFGYWGSLQYHSS